MSIAAALRTRPTVANSMLFLCDIQERFRPVIHNFPTVIAQSCFLNDVCKILGVPRLVTEHYLKAFGATVPELALTPDVPVFQKVKFSMMTDEVTHALRSAPNKVENILLCGIEAHVCVQQTALDLLEQGYNVHLIADAISSQNLYDRTVALQNMQQRGCIVTTASSIAFELMHTSQHPQFKTVSNLMKQDRAQEFRNRETL